MTAPSTAWEDSGPDQCLSILSIFVSLIAALVSLTQDLKQKVWHFYS